MTDDSSANVHAIHDEKIYSALIGLTESDLMRLLHRVKAFQREVHHICSSNPEPIELANRTQELLKIWRAELDRAMVPNQERNKVTNAQILDWVNEGGAVKHDNNGHPLRESASEKPPLVLLNKGDAGTADTN